MARINIKSWIEGLPTVMLGLRAASRVDTQVSSAELVYGTTIRLPGDFYDPTSKSVQVDTENYVHRLRQNIDSYKPVTRVNKDSRKIFIHKDLKECKYVFVRNDMVRRSLQPPYDGPYSVISRKDKVFTVQVKDRQVTISIDRLKPAYILDEDKISNNNVPKESEIRTHNLLRDDTTNKQSQVIAQSANVETDTAKRTTRSGRVSKMPVRFRL